MRAFVINLDRQPDRLERFREQNSWMFRQSGGPLFCERYAAFDGYRLDGPPFMQPRSRGNAMSHIELWQRAAKFAEPTLICEDDALLPELDYAQEVGDDKPFVLLGFNWDAPLCINYGLGPVTIHHDQQILRAALDAEESVSNKGMKPLLWPLIHAFGTPAYIITPQGARELLATLPLQNVTIKLPRLGFEIPNRGIDCWLNVHYERLSALVLFPPYAFTPNRRDN